MRQQGLDIYNIDEKVQVLMHYGDTREWRKAKVVKKNTIHPSGESKHRPYTMLIVEVIRTYFNAETKQYYDKLNTEGFVYTDQVKNL